MIKTNSIHVKKNDLIQVISGREKGKRGKILKINFKNNSAIVEKINFIKKHMRPNNLNKLGGIVEKEGQIHISKLMVICERCNKPVRIKHKILENKNCKRVCSTCNELLDKK